MTDDLLALAERVERAKKLAHEAPLNPYRLDADGHRWVEPISRAWADRAREFSDLTEQLERARAAAKEG